MQVKDEAEHLDGMVRNLLAMTRVEAGALEINRDWIDVRELFDRVVAMAKRRGACQRLEVFVEPELPFLSADSNLLGQVLSNLIGNAIRYAGPSAHVLIAAKSEADQVVVSVTDDGPGVSPDLLPRVFHKFVRAGGPAGDAGEGSGLGLAIAKGIIEAHGGSIEAQSPVEGGRGTRILFRLPIRSGEP
jgi:two-component system sensor histidine kinase KdpD